MATVALGNYAVDPFGIYPVPRWPGLTAEKAGQHGHDRMVKAYAMRALRPDVVVLGTSRVQYGIDPGDRALAPLGHRPYNAGLLGCDIYTARRYLEHAQGLGPVHTAVVGLDPLMFDEAPAARLAAGRDFLESRLARGADGRPQLPFAAEDLAATLLSWDALRVSARTLSRQATLTTDLLPSGQRAPAALARYFRGAGSTRASFRATEASYFADFAAARLPARDGPSPAFDHLEALIAASRAGGTQLVLYFTPQHVRLHEVARQAGMAATLEAWQARVAEVVALANAAAGPADAPGGPRPPPVALWDMSGISALTTEDVPPAEAGMAELYWFFEATHARDRLGHLMLTRMFAPAEVAVSEELRLVGGPASPATLPARQAASRAALAAWAAAHPADVADVRASRPETGGP